MSKTRRAPSHDALDFLALSEELIAAATSCRRAGKVRAAALLEVHASIAGGDAVCVQWLGERASSDQHEDAADLLAASGAPDARARATQVTAIIEMKNRVAYEARPLTRVESDILKKRARRLVEWAAQVVREAPDRP
jgi:hypothetical protein